MNNRYMMRGVSAAKEDVHNAIKNIDKGIFPQAFCKIIPDILGGDPEYCNIMHAGGGEESANSDEIKIGANFEMTGNVANYGTTTLEGLKLAIKEANDAGGINGKKIT